MQYKTCSKCKSRKPIELFGNWKYSKDGKNHRCRECHNAANRTSWHAVGSERRRELYQTDELVREKMLNAARASASSEKTRITKQKRHKELRDSILDIYGRLCACCGDSTYEFLTIDHVNGGGNQHRKRAGDTQKMYREILMSDTNRGEYQILCYNCNCAKGIYGKCPHQKET